MSTMVEDGISPSSDRQLMLDLFGDDGEDQDETYSSSDESDTTDPSIYTFDEVVDQTETEHKNGEAVIEYFELQGCQPDASSHPCQRVPLALEHMTSPPPVYWESRFPESSASPSPTESQTACSFYDHTSEDYMDVDDPHLYQAWATTVHSSTNSQPKWGRRSKRGSVVPHTASQNRIKKSKFTSSPYFIPRKGQRRRRHEPSGHSSLANWMLASIWPTF